MKELNNFRKFLNEGTWSYGSENQMIKALAQLDKIRKMGGVKGSVELDKLDSMLYRIFGDDKFFDAIDRAKDVATDDDQFVNALTDAMAVGKKMIANIHGMSGDLKEGTWSYGSENQMIKALEEMNAMMMHSDPRQFKAGLEAMDNALYRIFGDDNFHDEFSNAKTHAAEGDLDRAKNALGDAIGIGDRMIASIHGMSGDLEENNEKEVKEVKVFDDIDMMLDKAAVHMSADEVLQNLVSEFQIISGGTQILNMALKNIMADAGLMEENDTTLDEIIGEQKESLTQQIMKKYPEKYKDEKAVAAAAKELMKDPKYKVSKGITPVLNALLKGK